MAFIKTLWNGVSLVTTETTLRVRWFGVRILVGIRDFSLFENAILALGPTRFIFHGYQGKATRTLCWTLPSSSSEDKNEWSYTSTPPVCRHCADRDDFTFMFLPLRTKNEVRYIWWCLSSPTENSMYSYFCSDDNVKYAVEGADGCLFLRAITNT
jgi:hypothetical protein